MTVAYKKQTSYLLLMTVALAVHLYNDHANNIIMNLSTLVLGIINISAVIITLLPC